MAEELRPCPLCGSTDIACFAEECGYDYDNVPTFRAVVGCRGCHEEGCDPTYDDEPCFGIEAYYRADNPLIMDCEDPWDIERVLERHMAERWNRRAVRTCHIKLSKTSVWHCDGCGQTIDGNCFADNGGRLVEYRYCPNCGARIIKEPIKRPEPKVPDAYGVPIREGDTVWSVKYGTEYRVDEIRDTTDDDDEPCKIIGCSNDELHIYCAYFPPDKLTHTKPEIDTWERLREYGEKGCEKRVYERLASEL